MVFEVPEGVNVYDLIALAMIEQAAKDAQSDKTNLAEEARLWLQKEGRVWWDVLGLEGGLFEHILKK
ncbi:MAG: hypothetical protein C0391_06860 [Anaerolinea sp.]|nr:hypothetical protein [Anaerolinea sp.]